MSTVHCRDGIALTVVLVVLLSSRPTEAQVGVDPGPPREPGGLVNNLLTGVQYDIENQKLAEHRFQKLQEKLRRDIELRDSVAVDRDLRQIDNVRYRIAMNEWLIRWNSLQYPCFYTIRTDPRSCAAIAQATHPIPSPYAMQMALSSGEIPGPPTSDPIIPLMILNGAPAGSKIEFAIDGVPHSVDGGSRRLLEVAPNSRITYDSGGSLGHRRYLVVPGVYEFRSTAEGWALYKLTSPPEVADATRR